MSIKNVRNLILEIGTPLVLVAVWWVASANSVSFFFPPLSEILEAFSDNWLVEKVVPDVLPSLARMLSGLTIGCVTGVVLGLAIAQSKLLRRTTAPVVEFLRSIPSPALIPPSLVLLGIGDANKIFLIAFVTLWPVLMSTVAGVAAINPTLADTARMYGIRGARYIRTIMLNGAAPQIFAGMRTAIGLALIMMVVSEMTGATNGIGYFVVQSQRNFAVADMWSGIILLGIIGYLLALLFSMAERRILAWHRASRQSS